MLTIVNIEKLYKQDVGEWRIGKVVTMDSAYLIELRQSNGLRLQVNLERTAIGNSDSALYELWFWSNQSGSGIPIRRMLNKPDLKLGTVYVTDLIKDMLESLK
jgi:hypothetical protein